MTGTKSGTKFGTKFNGTKFGSKSGVTGTKPLKGFVPSGCSARNWSESRSLPRDFAADASQKQHRDINRDKMIYVPFGILSRCTPKGCGAWS